jgi:hypothetical protein
VQNIYKKIFTSNASCRTFFFSKLVDGNAVFSSSKIIIYLNYLCTFIPDSSICSLLFFRILFPVLVFSSAECAGRSGGRELRGEEGSQGGAQVLRLRQPTPQHTLGKKGNPQLQLQYSYSYSTVTVTVTPNLCYIRFSRFLFCKYLLAKRQADRMERNKHF